MEIGHTQNWSPSSQQTQSRLECWPSSPSLPSHNEMLRSRLHLNVIVIVRVCLVSPPSWPVSYSPSPPFSWCHCPGQRFPLLASHCILNINKERWNNVWRRCVNNVECVNDCFVWVNNKAWVFTNWCTKSRHDPGSAINPSPSHSLSHSWTWRLFLFTLSNLYGISTFHLDLV